MDKKSNGNKYVYFFGDGKADGNESMKNLLGGKGAIWLKWLATPNFNCPSHRDLR